MAAVYQALFVETRWAPLANGRTSTVLLDATLTVVSEVGRDHPDVAAWVVRQWETAEDQGRRWRRSFWRPWASKRLAAERGEFIGGMAAALTEWASFKRDDAWFTTGQLLEPAGR